MAQHTLDVKSLFRTSTIEEGRVIELVFKGDTDEVLLRFDPVYLASAIPRLILAVDAARKARRAKPSHS